MRKLIVLGLAPIVLVLAVSAGAEQTNLSQKSFHVMGAIDNGKVRKATFRLSDLPEVSDISDLPDELRSHAISFKSNLTPGSILVKTRTRRLYYILPGDEAIEYKVGVGREGFTWSGTNTVSRKAVWPEWRPPVEMIRREAGRGHKLPAYMEGGRGNPLGARAIYIGGTQYRIHGTTQPWSIGKAVSSGCIRMMNAEVIDLYSRVKVGATVVVED